MVVVAGLTALFTILALASSKSRVVFIVLAVVCGVWFLGLLGQDDVTPPSSTPSSSAPSTPTLQNPVSVELTSDPSGAIVYIQGNQQGITPLTVTLEQGEPHRVRLVPQEPYEAYDLYDTYTGTITPTEDGQSISFWIERTTAEEQAQQRQAYEEEQARIAAEREAERRAAEERARQRRIEQADLILEAWSWYKDRYGYVHATGRVTNRTGRSMDGVIVQVEFYTSSGEYITREWTFIDYQPILSGQTSPFELIGQANPAMQRGRISFRYFGGGTISFVDRDDL